MALSGDSLTLTSVAATRTVANGVITTETPPALRLGRTRGAASLGVSVVQVGTATTPASVDVQSSLDGVLWSSVKLFVCGTAAATYTLVVPLPESAAWVRIVNTAQSGGTSSTTAASLGLNDRVTPPRARVHTWSSGDLPTTLLANPAVMPMCRILIGASGDTAEDYAAECATKVAAIVAAKLAAGDPDASGYSVFLQNFGNSASNTDGPDLFRHTTDTVASADATEVQGVFNASGIAEAYAWSQDFAAEFRVLLEASNLPLPEALHFDVEAGRLLESNSTPASSTGWYAASLNDARAGTELIDGTTTLDGLVTAWEALYGSILLSTADTSFFSQGSGGRGSGTRFISALCKATLSWALYQSFVKAMVEVFPGILRCSNYGTWATTTQALAVPDRSKAWLLVSNAKQSLTHSAPELYPVAGAGFQGTSSLTADWASALGYTLTGDDVVDYSALHVARCTAVVQALVAGNQPIVPWINYPGEPYSVTQFGDDITTYTTLEADLAEIATMCANEGLRELVAWQGDSITDEQWSAQARTIEVFIDRVNTLEGV